MKKDKGKMVRDLVIAGMILFVGCFMGVSEAKNAGWLGQTASASEALQTKDSVSEAASTSSYSHTAGGGSAGSFINSTAGTGSSSYSGSGSSSGSSYKSNSSYKSSSGSKKYDPYDVYDYDDADDFADDWAEEFGDGDYDDGYDDAYDYWEDERDD